MKTVLVSNQRLTEYYGDNKRADILKKYAEEEFDLTINDKLVFVSEEGKVILKAKWKGVGQPLRVVDISKVDKLKLAKDIEQQFVLDDIADPDITLITVEGCAGSGKTFISLLGACKSEAERVIYTRENIEVGASLGYLQGGMEQKFTPYLAGMFDNLEEIKRLTGITYDHKVEAEPMGFLRGSSKRNTILIVDECQNCDLTLTKTAITRMGEGSKIILCGSLRQIDNKKLNKESNGLAIVMDRFKGQDLYSHNTLTADKRSRLAKLADELLGENE